MALSKFGSAFRSARKRGLKEFSFGGKRYNTKLASGGGARKQTFKSTPKMGPTPDRKYQRAQRVVHNTATRLKGRSASYSPLPVSQVSGRIKGVSTVRGAIKRDNAGMLYKYRRK
jgi:hypothetical protein